MMSQGRFAFGGPTNMKDTALLTLVFVVISSPLLAKPHHLYSAGRHDGYRHAYAEAHRYGSHDGRHHSYGHGAGEIGAHETGGRETHSHITCEMVRSYVAQVGLMQAKAMAQAAGMTASEERRARQCLANRV
jgi:hypothetical protein